MSAVMNDWIRRHLINVDEYYRMAEVGIIPPDARVELIEGEIIDMASMGPDHCAATMRLQVILTYATGDQAQMRSNLSLRSSDLSEPQPDFVLVRP